jgi:hypothetical protein
MGILRAILSFVRAFFASRAGLSYHSSCLTGAVVARSAAWQATAMVKHKPRGILLHMRVPRVVCFDFLVICFTCYG